MVEKIPTTLEPAVPRLILVVDDEARMRRFIRMNLELEGYQIIEADNGIAALEQIRVFTPDLTIMDVMMPQMDGFETLRLLREISTVPVILLTVKSDEEDKIQGLGLGADDYITKPFDIEELKLRVEGAIRRSLREALTHPVTNLPAGKLIEEQLKRVKDSAEPWTLLYFGVRNVNAFKEIYGPIQVNEVLIFLADIMREAVEAHGTLNDFIGQASDNDFIIISTDKAAAAICENITKRFNQECTVFYSFPDRERGYITYKDIDGVTQKADFMKIAVGVVLSKNGPFADIVQITEDAAENRRHNTGCAGIE